MPVLRDIEVLRPRPGAVVVECNGEHDLTTSDELAGLLSGLVADHELVVVDVSGADFVDSSFLHNLIKADRAAQSGTGHLRLQFGTAPIVRRIFELSGILSQLDWAPTREEALREAPIRE